MHSLKISLKSGYASLIWQLPLATVAFIWAFLVELMGALEMAWLNSFACIKIKK